MTHVFALTVTDNLGEAHTVEVVVTVTSSALPVAHAGEDQTVVSGVEVTLDPKFSSWGKTVPWQVIDVEPITGFGMFKNG